MFSEWWNSVLATQTESKMCTFCSEEDLCNSLCNACGATLSQCHPSMLWHRKWTQPCLSDTRMAQGHYSQHQTVIHCKTAVNSHTLRTGTVHDTNLGMTQFWKTLHAANLSSCSSGESQSCQTSQNVINSQCIVWLQMSKLWITVAKSSLGLWSSLYCLILHHAEWKGQKTLTAQQPAPTYLPSA